MHSIAIHQTERPRNVNAFQAAAILYGDLGTSKAYVIGLAYALAGHSSFWLIAGVSLLTILVGLNYVLICKLYPNGGGVYASVRHRSQVIALLGGFFLICDYILTAAISAISAFHYIGVAHPELWAIGIIILIGVLNFFGPKHTGNVAFGITACTIGLVIVLAIFSVHFLPDAVRHVEALPDSPAVDWMNFVGVIVALSGIEAIANMTGVMQLDPDSTPARPKVVKTATPAIIVIVLEVCFFTTLFSLAANALPGLERHGHEISAPGYPNVRDALLRYMGETFGTQLISPEFGVAFGFVISIMFAVLLFSAVNTSILALNSIMFVMSKDKQFPTSFQKINSFGVPKIPLIIATCAPVAVLLFAHDVAALASLYAIGFVGAIMVNLGSTSTDFSLDLKWRERAFMFATFLIMAAIELSLFIEKPHARVFVVTVVAAGLFLKALAQERQRKEHRKHTEKHEYISELAKQALEQGEDKAFAPAAEPITALPIEEGKLRSSGPVMCAATHASKSLEYSIKECIKNDRHLYVLFIREQKLIPHQGMSKDWKEDEQACLIFNHVIAALRGRHFTFLYDVSDLPTLNVINHAKKFQIACLVIGMPRRSKLIQFIRGNVVSDIIYKLPPEIDLMIIS